MVEHRITIEGHIYKFEAHPHPTGSRLLIEAPGVVPFDADSLDDARDTLRGLYSKKASV